MLEENKISEEHLVKLKEFTNFFTNAKLALGEAALKYESTKENILYQTKTKDDEFSEYQKVLQDAYGKVNINLETGAYTPVEEVIENKE